jgi:hypothetical protein
MLPSQKIKMAAIFAKNKKISCHFDFGLAALFLFFVASELQK